MKWLLERRWRGSRLRCRWSPWRLRARLARGARFARDPLSHDPGVNVVALPRGHGSLVAMPRLLDACGMGSLMLLGVDACLLCLVKPVEPALGDPPGPSLVGLRAGGVRRAGSSVTGERGRRRLGGDLRGRRLRAGPSCAHPLSPIPRRRGLRGSWLFFAPSVAAAGPPRPLLRHCCCGEVGGGLRAGD